MNKVILWIIWILTISALCLIIYLVFNVDKEYQLLFITGIGTVISAIIAHNSIKKREIFARHFESKSKSYKKFFDLFVDLALKKKKIKEDILLIKMIEIKKEILIWGSAETIKQWIEWEKSTQKQGIGHIELIKEGDKLFKAIRKDLGHNDNELNNSELMKFFLDKEARDKLEQQ